MDKQMRFCVIDLHSLHFYIRMHDKDTAVEIGYVFHEDLTKEMILKFVKDWEDGEVIEVLT